MVQQAFLKLWERPYLWDETKQTKFTTWFYKVIVHNCLDAIKKHKPTVLLDDGSVESSDISQEKQMILRQNELELENAIQSLPKRQQTALNLCFYEEISNKEAAVIMGVSLKALESLLMRAKGGLKQIILRKEI